MNNCRKNIIGLKKIKVKKEKRKRKKHGRRKKRGEKKGKLHRTAKPNIETEVYYNNKKCDWTYTYTYTHMSKVKTVQQKYSTVDWPSKQRKPKIIFAS